MKPLLACLTLLSVHCLAEAAPPPRPDLFVSTIGNDSWTGRLDKPNVSRTDGPFATIERARAEVRVLKSSPHSGPIVVCLRGGAYYLSAPLTFTPEDSGISAESPTLYTAYPGEQPIVSGGVNIGKMQTNNLMQWEARLEDVASGNWLFSQLFVDGQRRMRPRLPKYDYFRINGSVAATSGVAARGYDRFAYKPGDINPNWHDIGSVEALCFQIWTMARLRVAAVDDTNHIVSFTGPTNGTAGYAALPKGNRYIIENVREALQDPGEWYLDRKTGILTYLPLPGELPNRTVVIAPRLRQLVLLQGKPAEHKWVQNIEFRSIVFAHTNWNSPPEGNAFAQAEANLDAAISAVGARHCSFTNCSVRHTGNWAFEWGAGCSNNIVESCDLTDLGAGGVKIGEMGGQTDVEMVASNNTVRNCLIAHGGRLHPAATGVWIGQSYANEIVHNQIDDFYYTGISVGWTWGYGSSLAHDNKIAYNKIGDIGQGVLSDMGGIYTLGISTGSTIDHNVIHDVESFDYGGWGIYPDEGSSNLIITNNIVFRTKTGGYHQHYGEANHVTNNIFAFSREGQIVRSRAEDHLSFTFDHNIVVFKEGDLLGSNWSGNQFHLNNNVYWDYSGRPVTFAGQPLEQWQTGGRDSGSIIADPLFAKPEDGYFRLADASPAFRVGFKAIDSSLAGPHPINGTKFKLDAAPRAFPPPPAPLPPSPINEDFEASPVGSVVPDAITNEEPDGGTVRVTDETAATGKHSLKFTDKSGQKFSYNPHIFYTPKFETGTLQGGFAIRFGTGAVFSHEWRDNANPYNTGPSLRIDSTGSLYAGSRKLETLPRDVWIHFDIECTIGKEAPGVYTMIVTLPNGVIHHYADLPCSPLFKKITWYGFVSDTDGPSVFYIDDIKLHQ